MNKQKQAFTLVELIVVITILAILGTIAFISLQGYSTQARDSTRISDLSSMKSSLELYQVDAGKYPLPTNGINITYSGATVWNQGIFGETVYTNVEKLDKIPTDPLTSNSYTYSVTSTKTEYQLGGILEGDEVSFTSHPWGGAVLRNANAGETIANAIVTGSYNGVVTKSNSGTLCNILSLPSIITNDTTVTDLQQIVANNSFVYRGYKNLPSSFTGTKFKQNGGFAFTSNKLLAYSDTGSCATLIDKTSYTTRVTLLKGLQDAYTGTIVKEVGEIKNILDLVIDINNPSQEVIKYSDNFVNNNLGGNIPLSSNTNLSNSCSTQPTNASVTAGVPTSSNQVWQSSNPLNPCFFTCNAGYGSTGASCILSTDCNATITEITLSNSQTWSCLNVGATTVWNGSLAPNNCFGSLINCNPGLTWSGDYFQWGRNDNGRTNGSAGAPNNYGWEAQNNNKWGGTTTSASSGTYQTVSGSDKLLMQGPCPNGWHVPTAYEWKLACDNITGTGCPANSTSSTAVKTKLKLPAMGLRYYSDGNYVNNPGNGYYWSSTPYTQYAAELFYDATSVYPADFSYEYRADGMSVRCLKN